MHHPGRSIPQHVVPLRSLQFHIGGRERSYRQRYGMAETGLGLGGTA